MSIESFVKSYKSHLIDLINNIDSSVIEAIINAIETTVQKKSRIYILGNAETEDKIKAIAEISSGVKGVKKVISHIKS